MKYTAHRKIKGTAFTFEEIAKPSEYPVFFVFIHKFVSVATTLAGVVACAPRGFAITSFIWIPALAIVLFLITGIMAQEKSIPDHGSLTDCRMCHAEKNKMWESTGHSKAITRIMDMPGSNADCYSCHSAEGFTAKLQGNKVDLAQKDGFRSVTCVACHKPGSGDNPKMLVLPSEKICSECHSQRTVLEGKGAKGVEDTRSFHSGVLCVSCHMSEANHDMKLLRPDDPKTPDPDTCTRCHSDNNRKMRAKQLPDWQEFYKEAMDPIEADLAAISAAIKEKPDILNDDLKEKLNTVRANLFIIQRDGSRGAHNLDFSLEIMALAAKDIKIIKAAINSDIL